MKERLVSFVVGLLLVFITVSPVTSNQVSDQGNTDGTVTYSGEWSGSIGYQEVSGEWTFHVDFEVGEVKGKFTGDGAGDISGTVSNGKIEARGMAAFGAVQWSGEFESGREEISGTWELMSVDVPGSGTWSGSVGAPAQDAEDDEGSELPEDDQVQGEEPLERYPGSVMLSHSSLTAQGASLIEIEYGTEDGLAEVVEWYEEELGEPQSKKAEQDETTLGYMLTDGNAYAEISVSKDDYILIEVDYRSR